MKWVRRDVLPHTNTKNKKVAFNKEIQKFKINKWKPKSVRDQSQKLAWIISFQGFEMKIIKKGKYQWTISYKKCLGKNQKMSGLEAKK